MIGVAGLGPLQPRISQQTLKVACSGVVDLNDLGLDENPRFPNTNSSILPAAASGARRWAPGGCAEVQKWQVPRGEGSLQHAAGGLPQENGRVRPGAPCEGLSLAV